MTGRNRKVHAEFKTPPWLLTFADMNVALMTIFVMMLSTMTNNRTATNLSTVFSSIRQNIGIMESGDSMNKGALADFGAAMETLPSGKGGTDSGSALKQGLSRLDEDLKVKKSKLEDTPKGYRMSFPSDSFFVPGSAGIESDAGKEILSKIGLLLKALPDDISVEVIGHTDNTPIPEASQIHRLFPSNWELSSARASAVVRYLENFGVASSRLSAMGKGDSEPLEPNTTSEGKAANRRIEFLFYQNRR